MIRDIINSFLACINKCQWVTGVPFLYLLFVAFIVYSQKIVLCLRTVVCSSASFTPVSGAQHGPVLITFPPILLRCKKKVQYFNSVLMGLLGIHTPTHKRTFSVWLVGLSFCGGLLSGFIQDLQKPAIIRRGIAAKLTDRHSPSLCIICVYSPSISVPGAFSIWVLGLVNRACRDVSQILKTNTYLMC